MGKYRNHNLGGKPGSLDKQNLVSHCIVSTYVQVSTCIFKVHNVSQWPNLRHLAEPLEGA